MAKQASAKQLSAKQPYHHGDLPRALVSAAAHLVAAGAPLTLRAAAAAAGVSSAAPYRHFADREALLAAVLASGFHELARRSEAARAAAPGPLQAVLATGLAYVRFAAEHPRIYRLMFGPECDKANHPALMEAGHAAKSVLLRAVADGLAAGVLQGDSVESVALAGWAMSHGLASLHADGLLGDADVDASARRLFGLLFSGLRAPAAPAPGSSPPAPSSGRRTPPPGRGR
jgi:AcrR family transcriptional regulator